jgi:hypothetical protein
LHRSRRKRASARLSLAASEKTSGSSSRIHPKCSTRVKRRAPVVPQDINVLALVKGAERYVFLYDDASRAETLRVLGRFAANPELSFTWYDAAVLSQKIRQESSKAERQPRFSLPQPTDREEG